MKCLYALAVLALVLVLLHFRPFSHEGFQAMKSIIICKADWCGHCKKLHPNLSDLLVNLQLHYKMEAK